MRTVITKDTRVVAETLASGEVACVPTETVYGLGANALNEKAVVKIYETKDRPRFNPIIVHISRKEEFEKYGKNIPDKVYRLAEKFSPGPITFVVSKKDVIPDIVTAGNDSVGLRIPKHPLFMELLTQCGFPIAAPSANMFGRISPTTAEETLKELDGKIGYILDGGKCEVGIESTVISFVDETPCILRHGAITMEDIEDEIGKVNTGNGEKIISPGMTSSHYAPHKPLFVSEKMLEEDDLKEMNAVFMDLERFGSPDNIAVNLFSEMRKLDESDFGIIVCKKVEDIGIGIAINDKLERASSGRISFEFGMPVITQLKYV